MPRKKLSKKTFNSSKNGYREFAGFDVLLGVKKVVKADAKNRASLLPFSPPFLSGQWRLINYISRKRGTFLFLPSLISSSSSQFDAADFVTTTRDSIYWLK